MEKFGVCKGQNCQSYSNVHCSCMDISLCYLCLGDHLNDANSAVHFIEVASPPVNERTKQHTIDLILGRIYAEPSLIKKIKELNVSVNELIMYSMKELNLLTEQTGISQTSKYLLWDELNYLRIMTERIHLKDDPLTRLTLGLNFDAKRQVKGDVIDIVEDRVDDMTALMNSFTNIKNNN